MGPGDPSAGNLGSPCVLLVTSIFVGFWELRIVVTELEVGAAVGIADHDPLGPIVGLNCGRQDQGGQERDESIRKAKISHVLLPLL